MSSIEHAQMFDAEDPLKHFRNEFIVPSKADLKSKTLAGSSNDENGSKDPSIYLCGNSLGLQPHRTAERITSHLTAWAKKGVHGHFFQHEDSPYQGFLHIEDDAAEKLAPIVGALRSEVAVMETLTANLHLLMSSFYRPTKEKFKILIEGKAFPSDHYAVESQIIHHGYDPKEAMILIESPNPDQQTVSTSHVLSVIDSHASSTALILLPGIQYYTGQYFDIKTITAHAHSKGILIGWDLAHAVGNVDVQLHDWDVDFAAWCNYKYVNAGPGAIAALFVNEKYGKVNRNTATNGEEPFRPRLSGWWGGDKEMRFEMGNHFVPIPGAAGYQVGNPSALAITALLASLEIFEKTTMTALRAKSLAITGYLEKLLLEPPRNGKAPLYAIITPPSPTERGAQLSVLLEPGLLESVMATLEDEGVVVDGRKPDVIRVAPAPLYNTYEEVWRFVGIFRDACEKAKVGKCGRKGRNNGVMRSGKEEKEFGEVQ